MIFARLGLTYWQLQCGTDALISSSALTRGPRAQIGGYALRRPKDVRAMRTITIYICVTTSSPLLWLHKDRIAFGGGALSTTGSDE
jgi:hypothetical protein